MKSLRNIQTSFAAAAIFAAGVLTLPSVQADDVNFGSRVPSAQELIDNLRPQPVRSRGKTRGIKLLSRPAAVQTPVAAAQPGTPAPQVVASTEQAAPAPSQPLAVSLEVLFGFDSADLTDQAVQILHPLGQALQSPELAGMQFVIEGHTDAQGSEQYNLALSQRRALVVTRHLAAHYGVDVRVLQAVGRGEFQLLDTGNPHSGANRRVRIVNASS